MTLVTIWTEERITELKRLYTTHSAAQIAAALGGGLTRCAVIGKARRLGLALPVKVKAEPKPRSPRIPKTRSGEHHDVLRMVRNGGNGGWKVIQSVTMEMPVLRCVEIEPLHISLVDLQEHHCRYPYDHDGAPHTFCGHDKQTNSSWCPTHHRLCHEPRLTLSEQERERRSNHARRMRARNWSWLDSAEAS